MHRDRRTLVLLADDVWGKDDMAKFPPLCEVCHCVLSGEDLDDDVTVPADCCERIGLCAECRKKGNHDCDDEKTK